MPDLTDTQIRVLELAAARSDALAMPLPKGLHGAAAKKAVGRMIERGFLEEVDANIGRGEALWRETGDGHGTTLIATETGLAAIGLSPAEICTRLERRSREPAKLPLAPQIGMLDAIAEVFGFPALIPTLDPAALVNSDRKRTRASDTKPLMMSGKL